MKPLKGSARHRHQESKLPPGNHLGNRLFLRSRWGRQRERIYDSAALSWLLPAGSGNVQIFRWALSVPYDHFIKTRTLISLVLFGDMVRRDHCCQNIWLEDRMLVILAQWTDRGSNCWTRFHLSIGWSLSTTASSDTGIYFCELLHMFVPGVGHVYIKLTEESEEAASSWTQSRKHNLNRAWPSLQPEWWWWNYLVPVGHIWNWRRGKKYSGWLCNLNMTDS